MRSSDDSTFKIYYSQKEFRKVIADPKIYKDILGLSYYLLLPKRVSKLDPLNQVDQIQLFSISLTTQMSFREI
jgi:hypothetical protein